MPNSYDLKNKTVVITGSNGQLGRGLTAALLAQGAFVYVTDIQEEINKELATSLQNVGLSNYQYFKMDIASETSIREVMKNMAKDIDILINNAGVSVFTPFEGRSEAELDWVLNVNLKGTILCAKNFSRKMIAKKQGKIINIGSVYGVVPADKKIYGDSGRNNSEVYGASKAGVIQLTKYLAAYLGEHNIQVNAVSPGGIFNNQKKFFVDNYVAKTPLGRMAEVEDFYGLVCFLASDESNYITGQNITLDGGFSLNQ